MNIYLACPAITCIFMYGFQKKNCTVVVLEEGGFETFFR